MSKRRAGRKVRVEFRQNRAARARGEDLTRRFRTDADDVVDTHTHESVRPKGDLSRKRTIIVGEGEGRAVDESLWRPGTVTAVHGLVCRVADESGQNWDCTVRRLLRTLLIESRSPVTVGDRVWFSESPDAPPAQRVGVIEKVEPRRSVLSRRDRRGRQHTIVANADQLLIVASVLAPRLKPHLVDRYIVAALNGKLRPVVCLNKVDLLGERSRFGVQRSGFGGQGSGIESGDQSLWKDEGSRGGAEDAEIKDDEAGDVDAEFADEKLEDDGEQELRLTPAEAVAALCEELRGLGYPCVLASARTGTGLVELRELLRGHVTVLSGQSGVGKSSLINALEPELDLRVAEVSADTEKGKHTTSHAALLRLAGGGFVVDTPGIRAFDLWAVEPGQLEALFEEFVPYVQKCRFNDCLHGDEEGCAIRAAVEEGKISARRYWSYRKMFDELMSGRG